MHQSTVPIVPKTVEVVLSTISVAAVEVVAVEVVAVAVTLCESLRQAGTDIDLLVLLAAG